jgi:hypothetical protein
MRPIPSFVISLGLALAAVAAGAERLPMKGGRWLETDGPWRLDGRRVVFRTPDGVLRSLPASEVDLAAAASPPREGVAPVSLEPWPVLVDIPEPAPLPRPSPARPGRRLPPECVLVNPDPELPPEIVCGGRALESGPKDQIQLDSRPKEPLWPPSSPSTKPRSDSASCCDGSGAESGS